MKDSAAVSFALDHLGNSWYGTYASLIRYNIKTKRFQGYKLPLTKVPTQVFPLFADRQNVIWMGYNRHFIRYNPFSGTFTKFAYPITRPAYDFDFLQCFYEDGDRMWLGSVAGLFSLNIKSNYINHYGYRPSDASSLSSNYVLSLCNDTRQPERYLWIGTKGGGLNRLDKMTGKFSRYTTREGLSNNVVYGILPDDSGHLWLSTNNGLSRFNPATKQFQNFNVSDGLQSNEFNRYAYCKTGEGQLVFGGVNGINYFDPADMKPLPPPEVALTELRLFNRPVDFRKQGAPLKKDICFTDTVALRYEQNVITLQFAAMDYRKRGNAGYRYQMQGFDKDWIYAGTKREATYTNLDPGSYSFVVEGSFDDVTWSKHATSLTLIIIPPWWRTWWFYGLVTLITFSISYTLYRYRVAQLLKLERVRNRIARDLHDEVGSSISTIAIYSKVVREHLGSSTFNNEQLLKKITDNANEIMEAMGDIVWNINTNNDVFNKIIIRMREHAHQLFEAKGYTLHFQFDESLNNIRLEMERRRDFYLIYKEALNNIAKYAHGKNVWISLGTHNARIHLIIKDDGKGFNIEMIRKNSNGLTNMRFRAAALRGKIEINTIPEEGTEIRLSF